jgi:hypothetical protein
MMRVMKKNMNKQSYSRNRTKKRSINRFQPVFISDWIPFLLVNNATMQSYGLARSANPKRRFMESSDDDSCML